MVNKISKIGSIKNDFTVKIAWKYTSKFIHKPDLVDYEFPRIEYQLRIELSSAEIVCKKKMLITSLQRDTLLYTFTYMYISYYVFLSSCMIIPVSKMKIEK